LSEADKAALLGWSGFGLRAVGWLREAVQPIKAGLEMNVDRKDWENAAVDANNLSELMLTLGEVSEAVAFARESVTHADSGGDAFQREATRTALADALHQSGQLEEAERLFREAEEMQKKSQPGFYFLYSVQGFQFCDLLLERGKNREVMERAEKFFEWRLPSDSLLTISLDNLIVGRAWLEQAGAGEKNEEAWARAKDFLDRAVTGLREAGYQDYLPRGLFARAAYYRLHGNLPHAREDLSEALEIAEAGDMRLFICDYHLEAGRVDTADGKETEAKEHFRKAAEIIEKTGYGRRQGVVQCQSK
jgi:tetratricopeptide (TPR) repeat protein